MSTAKAVGGDPCPVSDLPFAETSTPGLPFRAVYRPMTSTVSYRSSPSAPAGTQGPGEDDLLTQYEALVGDERLHWTTPYRKLRELGSGGQGGGFLSERERTDGCTLPVALKLF